MQMESRKTRLLADDFLHELIGGRFVYADKVLQRMREEKSSAQWQRGYVNALEGMLLALGSRNDRSVLINQIGAKEANRFAKSFSRQSKNRMQSEFDRGFFAAWVDYMRALKGSKMP